MNTFESLPNGSSYAPEPQNWPNIWGTALTQPNETAYAALAQHAKASTAYLWLFGSQIVSFALLVLIGSLTSSNVMENLGAGLVPLICIAPFAGLFTALMAIIGVALVNWIARLLGGSGSFEPQIYLSSAWSAPLAVVNGVLTLIPFIGPLVGSALSFYALYLNILTVKVVHRLSWGKSVAAVLLPAIGLVLVLCVCIIGILMLLGPVTGEVFSEIQSMP